LTPAARGWWNARMSVEHEIRAAFREIILPEVRALHADLQALRAEMALVRAAMGPLRSILVAGLQRLDVRLEAIERGVRCPTPCSQSSPRCRANRRRST
jgi:hypothetical protein